MSALNELVDQTCRSADLFIEKYYALLDAPRSIAPKAADEQPDTSVQSLLALYSPSARISWNGNPIPVNDLSTFIARLPKSIHEVQAFDAHPISGSFGSTPSIVVSVTGQVTHGSQPAPSTISTSSRDYEFLPRVFSQSFILVNDPTNTAVSPQYVVSADSFRFVG